MAEIKSTLDIIMEKAKKFSVTEEEKKAFKRQEMEGKIKGLIQKYLDGLVDMERLKEDIAVLRKDDPEELDHLFRQEAVDRIQPGENSAPLLRVLSSAVGMDTGPIKKLLNDFDRETKQKRVRRERALGEEFRKKGISGSAVIPNLDADEEWGKVASEAKEAFMRELKSFA
jgi:DNA-binding protein YbaB